VALWNITLILRKLIFNLKEAIPVAKKLEPVKTRTIAMINQKGGVGKTTSVVNLGAGLARLGLKVLLLDLDAQAHLTYSLGINADALQYTVYDLFTGQVGIEQLFIEKYGLSILPASIGLAAAEIELAAEVGRESLLKNALQDLNGFDMILLDCPPNLGLLTLNALTAAIEVFVPLQAEFLSIKGLNKLMETVEKINKRVNPRLKITGIILTQYDSRLKLHNEIMTNLRGHFADKVFKTVIRRNVALAEATSFGQPIFDYAPRSFGAQDYMSFCHEVMQ
jgi:chromosome partitioning protein